MECGGVFFGEEALECNASGFLLGLLLGIPLGFGKGAGASGAVSHADFDTEALLVVGAGLRGEDVLRLPGACSLKMLLQGGFVVADGSREGVACLQGDVQLRDRRLDDVLFNEVAGGGKSSIEVECGDDGFDGVGEQCGFFSAAALLFTSSEAQEISNADAGGNTAKMTTTDERGAEASEFAFARVWKSAKERFGNNKPEDCVADEL
jgi:hypothetical protein